MALARRPGESTTPPAARSLSEQRDSIVRLAAVRAGVKPELAIAVSHVENWTGDSTVVSSAGAIGLMQVMPRWRHSFEDECGCGPLENRWRNACVGAFILREALDSQPDVDRALRTYHGSNKPRLHLIGDRYAAAVLQELAR